MDGREWTRNGDPGIAGNTSRYTSLGILHHTRWDTHCSGYAKLDVSILEGHFPRVGIATS